MVITNLDQALKLQNDFTTRLTQSLVAQSSDKTPAIDAILKEKEQMISRAKAEVDTALKEREISASYWDGRVAQHKANVARLQKEVKDLNDQLVKQKSVSKISTAGAAKNAASVKKPG